MLLGIAYVNLADALQLSGLADEARAVTEEGLAEVDEGVPGAAWLPTMAAELAIDRGDYAEAEAQLRRTGRTTGNTRVNVELRRAELALCRGDDEAARASLEEAEALLVDSLEPQFVAVAGVLRAELDRRGGHPMGAREAVESALERLEFCSDDTVRLGAAGADRRRGRGRHRPARAGPRRRGGRGRRDRAGRRDAVARRGGRGGGPAAGDRLPRDGAGAHAARLGRGSGPGVAAALRRVARARPAAGGGRRAVARRRGVPGARAARRGGRGRGARAGAARELGAAWLVRELEGLIARARLTVDAAPAAPRRRAGARRRRREDDDPFGLTPRERQVLALVARGATNREIGAELFMAEKTASVHVSRILAKLDVRSRTEAAAVAHRLGLVAD